MVEYVDVFLLLVLLLDQVPLLGVPLGRLILGIEGRAELARCCLIVVSSQSSE